MFKKVFISIIILLTTSIVGFSQTVLVAGDIAIVAVNADGADSWSFVLLRDITNTTLIKFTDNGWLNTGSFRTGEGVVTWTATSNLTCGTEIVISSDGTVVNTGTVSKTGSFALSTSGDQLIAYQGPDITPTNIYAINNDGAGVWQADATSSNTSAIPTGLTNGTNAVAVIETDNVKYDCSTTTPPAAILAAVSNNANWLSDDTTPYTLPVACGFTCAACVADPQPTTNSSSLTFPNTTCNSIDLSWSIGDGANRIVVASISPIAGTPTDQTAYTANSTFGSGSTIAAGEFVVYNGSGNTVSVTGLAISTTYYFAIFEYNGSTANCEENYYTTSILTGNETTNLATQPTVNSTSLSFPDTTCNSINLSWTLGNGTKRIVVASTSPIAGTPSDQTAYTANSVFGSGSTIAAGEFVVYNGSGTSFMVTGLTASTTYYFAIFEYNGTTPNCEENYFLTSVLTGNFATPVCPPSACPEITGFLVDACTGNEGYDEFLTFQNGNTNLQIDSLTVNFPTTSIGPYCNSGCGSNTWTTNPAYVTTLNDTAGCPGLFVEADPIPAGAEVFVFTGANPTYSFDFTGLCGTGPYYAIFANNTTDPTGRFGNYGACATRTLRVDFGALCSDTANYDRCLLSNTDGDFVSVDIAGNPTYLNDGCTPIAPILPITLVYFNGKSINNNSNLLEWSTAAEINNAYFTIERAANALDFSSLGTMNGAGNSNTQLYYSFVDDTPNSGINYYRLKQTDFNGEFTYSNIISLKNNSLEFNISHTNQSLLISTNTENTTIDIYDLIGKLVYSSKVSNQQKLNTSNFNDGIYIIKLSNENDLLIKKIKF